MGNMSQYITVDALARVTSPSYNTCLVHMSLLVVLINLMVQITLIYCCALIGTAPSNIHINQSLIKYNDARWLLMVL